MVCAGLYGRADGRLGVMRRQIRAVPVASGQVQLETLLNASLIGILAGGRLGYVMFYNPAASGRATGYSESLGRRYVLSWRTMPGSWPPFYIAHAATD